MAKPAPIDLSKLPALAVLSESARKQLAADVARAQELHATHIRRAMAEALDHIPWILRAPIRKIFR